MRNLGTLLSFLLVATTACSSPARNGEEPSGPSGPSRAAAQDGGGEAAAGGAPGALPDDPYLRERFEQLSLAEQKQAILVEQHLAAAAELREALRLEDAQMELVRALELDPDNLSAKQALAEVGALLGQEPAAVESMVNRLRDEYELRVQQLRLDAEDSLRRGKVMLARGDYDGAIAEFQMALQHVRWSQYDVDWQGLDEDAAELLDRAKSQRAAAAERERVEAQKEAHAQLLRDEQAEQDRRQNQVNTLLDRAITAFELERFDQSMQYAEEALRKDARNSQAAEIRDAAFRAGREKFKGDYLARRKEQFKRWQEEIEEVRVPYTGEITLPDREFWDEITETRARRQGLDLTATIDPQEAELRGRLSSTRLPGLVIVEEESLTAVVDAVRVLTALPLVVDPLAEEAAIDEGVVFELNLTNPLTVEKALNLIADQAGEEVAWTIRHDAVLFTTRAKARGNLIIYNHSVSDLIFGLTDFQGPRIDRLLLLEELDSDEGSPFGGIGELVKIIDPDDLVTLVQDNVAVGTWEDEGVSISPEMGNMVVVHEPAVQQQVKDFLEDLRRFSSTLVTIESKFMKIEDNWIQEIGVEWRGLDNPGTPFTDLDDVTNGLEDMAGAGLDNGGTGVAGSNAAGPPSAGFFYDDGNDGNFIASTSNIFSNPLGSALSTIGGLTGQVTFLDDAQVSGILRLVEKSNQGELINDQILSVHNTQRAYVTVVNQRAYVQDFDVEVAQFEAIADPQINVLTEGIVLDVRPTIHHDRKYLTLEIQPTVANVVALETFSTTLGSNTSPVEFVLPELEVQSVFTTVVIPDGGSILLGGLSRVRDVERRAEVPWLANLPLVGFFFKEEGYSDENSSLMIMIKAWITDVKEELAKLEGR